MKNYFEGITKANDRDRVMGISFWILSVCVNCGVWYRAYYSTTGTGDAYCPECREEIIKSLIKDL